MPTVYLPLFVIIMFSMMKDWYEDYKRYKSDKYENENDVLFYNKNEFIIKKW